MERGAVAILALLDGEGDREVRFEGAMLLAGAARDLFLLRTAYTKPPEG